MDDYVGLQRLDASEMQKLNPQRRQPATSSMAPRELQALKGPTVRKKSSISGFFEVSESQSFGLPASVERARKVSRDTTSTLGPTSNRGPSFTTDFTLQEELSPFRPDVINSQSNPLASPFFKLYLAHIAISGMKGSPKADGRDGVDSGMSTPLDEMGEHQDDIHEVARRLDSELKHTQERCRYTSRRGSRQDQSRRGSLLDVSPLPCPTTHFDLNKVYRDLERSAAAAGKSRPSRVETDYIPMTDAVFEEKIKKRADNVIAPVSF